MNPVVRPDLCSPPETAPVGSRHLLLHSDGATRFTCTWLAGWWRLPPWPPKWPDGQLWTPEGLRGIGWSYVGPAEDAPRDAGAAP